MKLFKAILKWCFYIGLVSGVFAVFYFNLHRYVIPNPFLKDATSTHMKRHQHDLIDWRPFNKETVRLAKDLNKPLFLSIGFSTSRASKAMQLDSFRHPLLAKVINRHFVPVLVDVYQFPKLGSFYMNLMIFQRNMSGWPMTMITTPDGVPLFLSTAMTRSQLFGALNNIQNSWKFESSRMIDEANSWINFYENRLESSEPISLDNPIVTLTEFLNQWFDTEQFGIKGRIKFPYFYSWQQLITISPLFSSYAQGTVDRIITSPMFDFVEGGVHRYSLDSQWSRPDFEKPLIDQLNFIYLLLQLYEMTKNPLYLDISEFTMTFLLKQLKTPSGLFSVGLDIGPPHLHGMYFMFSDDFLDAMSPLNFARRPVIPGYNLTALISINDFYGVDRQPLLVKRMNSNRPLKMDGYVSIRENAKALTTLNYLQRWRDHPDYRQSMQSITTFLLSQDVRVLALFDLLIIYDVLMATVKDIDLTLYVDEIRQRLSSQFPFVVPPYSFLNESLQTYDYLDQEHFPQELYYLLKHRSVFLDAYDTHRMCADLRSIIYGPWKQLSLVKLYNNSCL